MGFSASLSILHGRKKVEVCAESALHPVNKGLELRGTALPFGHCRQSFRHWFLRWAQNFETGILCGLYSSFSIYFSFSAASGSCLTMIRRGPLCALREIKRSDPDTRSPAGRLDSG